MRAFVDTGAWVAFCAERDQRHAAARSYARSLTLSRAQWLTTDYVVDESITRLRYDYGHPVAVRLLVLLNGLNQTDVLRIAPIDEQLFGEAKAIFLRYRDAVLSFTDCTSFAYLHRSPVDAVFGFDRHFAVMGHVLQPH